MAHCMRHIQKLSQGSIFKPTNYSSVLKRNTTVCKLNEKIDDCSPIAVSLFYLITTTSIKLVA